MRPEIVRQAPHVVPVPAEGIRPHQGGVVDEGHEHVQDEVRPLRLGQDPLEEGRVEEIDAHEREVRVGDGGLLDELEDATRLIRPDHAEALSLAVRHVARGEGDLGS